jgi:hypothetical protein
VLRAGVLRAACCLNSSTPCWSMRGAGSTEEARLWVAALADALQSTKWRSLAPGDAAGLVATSEGLDKLDVLLLKHAGARAGASPASPGRAESGSTGQGSPMLPKGGAAAMASGGGSPGPLRQAGSVRALTVAQPQGTPALAEPGAGAGAGAPVPAPSPVGGAVAGSSTPQIRSPLSKQASVRAAGGSTPILAPAPAPGPVGRGVSPAMEGGGVQGNATPPARPAPAAGRVTATPSGGADVSPSPVPVPVPVAPAPHVSTPTKRGPAAARRVQGPAPAALAPAPAPALAPAFQPLAKGWSFAPAGPEESEAAGAAHGRYSGEEDEVSVEDGYSRARDNLHVSTEPAEEFDLVYERMQVGSVCVLFCVCCLCVVCV